MSIAPSNDRCAPLDPTLIPSILRERAQWVCWKYIIKRRKKTKLPVKARDGEPADSTAPSTWSTFDEALGSWEAHHDYAGIGFVFSENDPFTGIDIDGCFDQQGQLVPPARELVDQFESYAEVSPSCGGVKIFIIGRKPVGARCKSKKIDGIKEIEIYSTERFFTVTGKHLSGTLLTIEDRQPQLEALCARLWPCKERRKPNAAQSGDPFAGDDQALIAKACSARDGEKFRRLWAGDLSLHGNDHSAADLAMCNLLAFWTGCDAWRIDALFRQSGLFRDKWDEKRGASTYGQRTIEEAIANCSATYSQPQKPSSGNRSPSSDSSAPAAGEVDGLIPLGERDPKTNRLVLSPKRTLPTAVVYVREFNHHQHGRTLHNFGGVLMEWRDNRYVQVEAEFVKNRLQPWLHNALRYVYNKGIGDWELVDFESNPATVNGALETIESYVHLPITTGVPSWLTDSAGKPPALEILPCKTMNLHVPTGRIIPSTPALFTVNALDFDYHENPEAPERWIKFLEQLFGDDLESVDLLQEWMGYVLIADTSQQKMLLLVGPRRSGKGTIGRIVKSLVGAANVAGPTTSSLAGNFGLQPLIDKSLAIVSDARFSGENVGTVVERLLCISGEDTLTVDRKYLPSVTMKLATRFMFLTNELPRLTDASTALAGRFLVLRLTQSFYGKEDITLTDQLLGELPGILAWALEGLKRLRKRGYFVQPASSEEAIRDLEDLASPVSAFVRECCIVRPGHRVQVQLVYDAWRSWCERDGRQIISSKMSFGKDLVAAFPNVRRRRGTDMVPYYDGIALSHNSDNWG